MFVARIIRKTIVSVALIGSAYLVSKRLKNRYKKNSNKNLES